MGAEVAQVATGLRNMLCRAGASKVTSEGMGLCS